MAIPRHPFTSLGRLTPRQLDWLLTVSVITALATGLASWTIGTAWARVATVLHAIAGLSLLVLTPGQARRLRAPGLRRNRPSRYLSIGLGVVLVATVTLGLLHATGLWYGVGRWSALWTHVLLAALAVPLVLWHVASRSSRLRRIDLDRRALLGAATTVAVAGGTYTAQEIIVRAASLAGAERRFTGSHEIASFEPARMPTVQWLDDRAPDTSSAQWVLTIGGRPVAIETLAARARPVEADLDCTGGWWSRQRWDAVPLAELLPDLATRSVEVASATGYRRRFPARDADHLHLAVGYDGEPLQRGHGAPVRLVAPGRRGPWWVKWVVSVEPDDRPWWLQFPFPLT